MEEHAKVKWYDNKALVIILIIIFFPVGIYALWKSSKFSKKTRAIITGVVALIIIIGFAGDQKAKNTVLEANQLWDSGNKSEAVQKYKDVIKSNITSIDRGDRLSVFQRVIEFDVEQGNNSSAKYLIEKAINFDVPISFGSSEANNLLSQVQREKKLASIKFLSISKGEVLSTYSPAPDKIGSENTLNGTTIDNYSCKFHTLELESFDGRLIRTSLKYNIPYLKTNSNAFVSFALFSAVFGQKIAGVNLTDKSQLSKLGLNNAYDPGPDELVHNGVKLSRYIKGGTLFFEAVAQ